jgi:hypothetical protein
MTPIPVRMRRLGGPTADAEEGIMLPRYEIRLTCPDGRSADDVFADLTVTTDGDAVLVTGRLDQSALHGVLERIRLLRWELVDVRRTRSLRGSGG